jgi:hypothetical protein
LDAASGQATWLRVPAEPFLVSWPNVTRRLFVFRGQLSKLRRGFDPRLPLFSFQLRLAKFPAARMQLIHSLNELRMPAGCTGIHALKCSAVAILTVIFNSIYKDATATDRTAAEGPPRPESTPRSIVASPCSSAPSRWREPVRDKNEDVYAHSRRDGEPLAKNAPAFQSSCAFTRSYIN